MAWMVQKFCGRRLHPSTRRPAVAHDAVDVQRSDSIGVGVGLERAI